MLKLNSKSLIFTKLISNRCNNLVVRQLVNNTSIKLSSDSKKKGLFVDLPTENNDNNKMPKRVKLYPGFQKSLEDNLFKESKEQNQVLSGRLNSLLFKLFFYSFYKFQQLSNKAKKVIEDFYGLNELEIDEVDEKVNDVNNVLEGSLNNFNLIQLFVLN